MTAGAPGPRRPSDWRAWLVAAALGLLPSGGAQALVALPAGGSAQPLVPLTPGMIIDHSIVVRPGRYWLASTSIGEPALRIRGENITVDFNGAVLEGGDPAADPDTYRGAGLVVEDSPAVTIKNARIRGYQVGILARRTPRLHITTSDVSYNWKPRLYSGIDKESLVDWMSYHHDEQDEWLTRGAGIYIAEADEAEIDHTVAVQGQNGLMVTRSRGVTVWNNTFQFLSGIGVGLYRVTDSRIMHNRIDWCVRGYSHGFYNRGQDSAGLLMYEQSSRNVVAYNSITHGGDGLFLWAGQSTMDTGKGGSGENVFYANDFSHAVANGIEATFSGGNQFIANRVEECWHGVWGGYSWDTLIADNRFAGNTDAIAIEHGSGNSIVANTFDGDETAVRLWQNATQDPSWQYPKLRDTRSAHYVISGNTIRKSRIGVSLTDTADVLVAGNDIIDVEQPLVKKGQTPAIITDPAGFDRPVRGQAGIRRTDPRLQPLAGAMDAMIPGDVRRGRETIIVDEWGPYDWKSPKLWPAGRPGDRPVKLRVLGPAGAWRVATLRGASADRRSGTVPGEITLTPIPGPRVDLQVRLEYRGASVTSPRGIVSAAGRPYRFGYRRFFVPIDWRVQFFGYTDDTDPVRRPEEFSALMAGAPIGTLATDRLDYLSARPFEDGVPADRFALTAEGSVSLPPGEFVARVISDDAVRVWVDGKLALDSWDPHESRVDTVPLRGGGHKLRVQYYEVTGFAELRFDIQRR